MQKSNKLRAAKKAKNDEFYTRYEDIEDEIQHYKRHFEDKKVFCNCDLPQSNFVKYFTDKFDELELKSFESQGLMPDGHGDFRSDESIALLKESDIIVTNPPFSLFREYIALMEKYNKKYLVLGNMNAVSYKEIFPLFKENKLWFGSRPNRTMIFDTPEEYGKKEIKVNPICWYTNMEHDMIPPFIELTQTFDGIK